MDVAKRQLEECVDTASKRVSEILAQLQWTEADVKSFDASEYRSERLCPHDASHVLPMDSARAAKHIQKCQLRSRGIDADKMAPPLPSSAFSYKDTTGKVEFPDIFENLTSGENKEKMVDAEEKLARERDYRRRRQSYRARNTHITKRTPTQILRALISKHMELLQQDQPK